MNQQDHNIIPFPGQPEETPVHKVYCSECGSPLEFYQILLTAIEYRCENDHIRQLPRPDGKKVPIRWVGGPDDAA